MKRFYLLLSVVFSFCSAYSQIGIGTTSPNESSILDVQSSDKGVLIPRMTETERNNIINPSYGLVIFNITENCLQINSGTSVSPNWACVGTSSASVMSNCYLNGFEGTYINSVVLTASNKFSVTITNNSFSNADFSFTTSDLILRGVGGITVASVNPPSVTLTSGNSQLVEYTLSGTPTSTGTLLGVWTKLGLSCVQQVNVTN